MPARPAQLRSRRPVRHSRRAGLAALAAVLGLAGPPALSAAGPGGCAALFSPSELGRLHEVQGRVNHLQVRGAPQPDDPDGAWDDDNVAYLKHRELRDRLGFAAERLTLAWATPPAGPPRMVVLVRGRADWVALQDRLDAIVGSAGLLEAGWRLEALPYEPDQAPSAPWTMRARDRLASFPR